MNTDERFHMYCRNPDTVNNDVLLDANQKLIQRPYIEDDYDVNTQNQLNEEIKHNSINLSTSYWNNIFESMKLVNKYWTKILDIGIDNPSAAFQNDRIILCLK